MRRALGVNTWVWASPLSDATLETLAGKIARLRFTAIELPVEQPGDWSPERRHRALSPNTGSLR